MPVLPIVTGQDTPILRAKAKPVPGLTKQLKKLIKNMKQTLESPEVSGVGLAAPQVNESIQLFIAMIGGPETGKLTAFINPTILHRSAETDVMEEGCLSLPNVKWAKVERPVQITLSYTDENGKPQERQFSEFDARVIQHEYDHLQGVLYIDY